jgi:YbgC/YbaW family acyl-CoA thioester hydrolase
MFEQAMEVRLADTDAAGLVFFANHFKIAHHVYETFMASVGFGLHHILDDGRFLLPIVHAEADYKTPLRLGDRFRISLRSTVQDHSFILTYHFRDLSGNILAEIMTVHVLVDKKTGEKLPLSEELRRGLMTISSGQGPQSSVLIRGGGSAGN